MGAGAFGTALAIAWSRDHAVRLVARDVERVRAAPAFPLPSGVTVDGAVGEADLVAYATPAQTFAAVAERHPPGQGGSGVGLICAKGIDVASGRLLPAIRPFAVLSGPGFAAEIARGLPTALTVAGPEAERLVAALGTPRLRLYASDDALGAAAGGALKNVAALAVGMARGLRLGASAEAALTTRAFAELARLVVALGGRAETFNGLSGLGDLVLTCSSPQSRNFSHGVALAEGGGGGGKGEGRLVEGVHTAGIAARLARRHGIATPIVDAVAAIVAGELSPDEAVTALLNRPLRRET